MRQNYGPLAVAVDGGVATVTIDHPPHNLVDGPLIAGLGELLDDAEASSGSAEEVRVAVFRSADPDFFLMHGDVERLVQVPGGPHTPLTEANLAARTFERLTTGPTVTVAAIDGAARGGGMEFLSACDIRFGSPRTVIGQPEVPMGILPGAGGGVRLARLLGRSRALEVILTGRDIAAPEALAIGWLTALAADGQVDAVATAFARQVAAMPPGSLPATKAVVNAALAIAGPGDALLTESNALAQLMAAGAHTAPMRRFLDAGGQTRAKELDPEFWATWWEQD